MSLARQHERRITIVYTPRGESQATKLLTEDELNNFELEVAERPDRWPLISGTGGIRKARVAMQGRGKSSGARICYVWDQRRRLVWVLVAYSKSKKASLTRSEKQTLRTLVNTLLAPGGYSWTP